MRDLATLTRGTPTSRRAPRTDALALGTIVGLVLVSIGSAMFGMPSSGDRDEPSLRVYLTDAPVDLDALHVTIDKVTVGDEVLTPTKKTVDLLQHRGLDKAILVSEGPVKGSMTLPLEITFGRAVVQTHDGSLDAAVPRSTLRIPNAWSPQHGAHQAIVLDIHVPSSLIQVHGQWEFRPFVVQAWRTSAPTPQALPDPQTTSALFQAWRLDAQYLVADAADEIFQPSSQASYAPTASPTGPARHTHATPTVAPTAIPTPTPPTIPPVEEPDTVRPLRILPGADGTASIAADSTFASATVHPPLLVKEIPLWQCIPPQSVEATHEQCSIGGVFADNPIQGSIVFINPARFDPEPVFVLQADVSLFGALVADTRVRIELIDSRTQEAVADSEIVLLNDDPAVVRTLARSQAFALGSGLIAGGEYSFRAQILGGGGASIHDVKVLSIQAYPSRTLTYLPLASAFACDRSYWTTPDSALTWTFDPMQYDGLVEVSIEVAGRSAYLDAFDDKTTGFRLYNANDYDATIDLGHFSTGGVFGLRRSPDIMDRLREGDEYRLQCRFDTDVSDMPEHQFEDELLDHNAEPAAETIPPDELIEPPPRSGRDSALFARSSDEASGLDQQRFEVSGARMVLVQEDFEFTPRHAWLSWMHRPSDGGEGGFEAGGFHTQLWPGVEWRDRDRHLFTQSFGVSAKLVNEAGTELANNVDGARDGAGVSRTPLPEHIDLTRPLAAQFRAAQSQGARLLAAAAEFEQHREQSYHAFSMHNPIVSECTWSFQAVREAVTGTARQESFAVDLVVEGNHVTQFSTGAELPSAVVETRAIDVRPGQTLEVFVRADTTAPGSTTVDASLIGRCNDQETVQSMEFVVGEAADWVS